jgi:hypothetical protein
MEVRHEWAASHFDSFIPEQRVILYRIEKRSWAGHTASTVPVASNPFFAPSENENSVFHLTLFI